jgi:hypothetical protein
MRFYGHIDPAGYLFRIGINKLVKNRRFIPYIGITIYFDFLI